jgi:hypothetical protein
MKTILLTGAAGAVGAEALRELVRRRDRYAIRVWEVRNPRTEKALRPFRDDVEVQWVDLTDRPALAACVHQVDSVIHLAAIIPPLADRQPALAERVNAQGTDHNFHCGYFLDSDELERIVHFQRDSFEDYLACYAEQVPALRRWISGVLRRPIKHYLLRQSDPYRALRQRDRKLIQRFFRDANLTPRGEP